MSEFEEYLQTLDKEGLIEICKIKEAQTRILSDMVPLGREQDGRDIELPVPLAVVTYVVGIVVGMVLFSYTHRK